MVTPCLGTKGFQSPEIRTQGIVSEKADVYSYGITLWEIIHRTEYREVSYAGYTRPSIHPDCPAIWRRLMERAWEENYSIRPLLGQVLAEIETLTVDGQYGPGSALPAIHDDQVRH